MEKLRIELARRNWTQKHLSEVTGISKTTINNVYNGKECELKTLRTIAEALEISLKDLI